LKRAPRPSPPEIQRGSSSGIRPVLTNETDAILHEVHHCVRNNFQIIVSLINLQRRLVPDGMRGGVHFIEEHVQAMAVVYRIADVRAGMHVSVNLLVQEVVEILRDVAGVAPDVVTVSVPRTDSSIEQRRAVALALLLAIIVPAAVIDSKSGAAATVAVALGIQPNKSFTLSVTANWDAIQGDPLRKRLTNAYLLQLSATTDADERQVRVHFR
jgi:Histidine kinase